MRWDDLDLNAATWTIPDTKSGQSVTLPLVPDAMRILVSRPRDGEFVFPSRVGNGHLVSPQKAWKSILKRAGLTDLRVHDLRRTLGRPWQAAASISLPIIGRSLRAFFNDIDGGLRTTASRPGSHGHERGYDGDRRGRGEESEGAGMKTGPHIPSQRASEILIHIRKLSKANLDWLMRNILEDGTLSGDWKWDLMSPGVRTAECTRAGQEIQGSRSPTQHRNPPGPSWVKRQAADEAL